MQMVKEQHGIAETSKAHLETQRSTLCAVNAERDDLIAQREDLARAAVGQQSVIEEQGHEIEMIKEARQNLEREVEAKNAQLAETERQVGALHQENAQLAGELQARGAAVDAAEGRLGALADRNNDLLAQVSAAESARVEAEENIRKLMDENGVLEEEISAGESSVLAIQAQTAESFACMHVDREQLVERNRALARQMVESQDRLDTVRRDAETIITVEKLRSRAMEQQHGEMLAELEKEGGAAALRPMLVAAQQALGLEKERAAALAAKNEELVAAAGARDDAATRAERDAVPVGEVVRARKEAAAEIETLKVCAAAAEARVAQYEQQLADVHARGVKWSGQQTAAEGRIERINRYVADSDSTRTNADLRASSGGSGGGGGSGETYDDAWRDLDLQSVAGYSESNMSEIPNPNDLDGIGRLARAAKAQANKGKFEQIKAQRNQYKAGLRAAQQEVEGMRAEMAAVEHLREQVRTLQDAAFL
uniref:Uncharacterized protein n=1 Tax=Mantoniella antarctica TaxID=81844 RepID=A0A7S0X5V8_9CHLO|mmetsp:Transcript_21435/g.52966  ORF Transcript_21435/g.52966 Transcript_21435/m.52966 type:complete len:482 (+) Transcript_21435:213-1658(+)